jgi:hypothetical protein
MRRFCGGSQAGESVNMAAIAAGDCRIRPCSGARDKACGPFNG